jgi:hypothetical protein
MQNIENKCKGTIQANMEGLGGSPAKLLRNIPNINTEMNIIYATGINRKILNLVRLIVAVPGSLLYRFVPRE